MKGARLGKASNKTWKGDSWKLGGCGAWLHGSHDPALNLLYYWTNNPSPWNASIRGLDRSNYGQFTNLYTTSTLAINADTGKLAWHYQSTPHDAWDYDGGRPGGTFRDAELAAQPATTTNSFSGDPAVIRAARSFSQNCAHCHSSNAMNPEPRTDLRRLRRRYGDAMTGVVYTTIAEGRPTKGMPPWKGMLSDERIWKILTFLEPVQTEP